MTRDNREILALFVMARREHIHGFDFRQAAEHLGIAAAQLRAVECHRVVKAETVATLAKWCGIEMVGDQWRECHASD